MTFNCQRSKKHKRGPKNTRQADSPVISEYTNWKNKKLWWEGKKEVFYKTV
jgi:hypothetical protein